MSISNLSIVFGPTLLGAPPEEGGMNLEHMSFQCKVSLPSSTSNVAVGMHEEEETYQYI